MAVKKKTEESQLLCKEIRILERVTGTHEVNGEKVIEHELESVRMHVNSIGLNSMKEVFYKNIRVDIDTLPEHLLAKVPAVKQFFTDVAEFVISEDISNE